MAFIRNLAYEASAGSGKTFMLVVRYLSLLFQGADPAKILALTFTNKAASEMTQRIVETLESLQERDELQEIVAVTEMDKESILAQRDAVLQNFLNADTKIMTIDSFFTKILRKFSLYASLMPDFTTANAQHEIKLLNRFLLETSVKNKRNTLVDLSLESKKRFGDIFHLLNEVYEKKEEIRGFAYTKNFDRSYETDAMEALATIQGIVSNCPKASPSLKKAVDIASFEALLGSTWVYKETLQYWVFKKCYTPQMDAALMQIQQSIRNYFHQKEQNFFSALFELSAIYEASKKSLYMDDSELSFSDVTLLVHHILHNIQDSSFLYFRLDSTIEHMLLDEFQDTSVLQYTILKPLIEEITSGAGIFENGSFFFVGDVKQSIYRFRGGVAALFHEVAQEQKTQVQKLVVNYRSRKEVVAFVNEVFEKKMRNYTPQQVRKGAEGGYVAVISNESLLEEVVSQVEGLLEMGAVADEIAILCATNADGEEVKHLLESKSIDVVTETTTRLIHQNSVAAVIEYLKYVYFKEEIYKRNFFARIGVAEETLPTIPCNSCDLVSTVKAIIERYGLFNNEFHLIRFLHVLESYKDIEAFLFEYERLDTAAAASDLQGVRILTTHKSKGLEYEHVIVMDRLKKAPSMRSSIIYEYEGIRLQNLYLRMKNRELLDANYAEAIAKEKSLVHEDTLNALYVAFTRAKRNLFIVRKEKGSLFETLELEDIQRGVLTCKEQQPAVKQPLKTLEYQHLYYGGQENLLSAEKSKEEDIEAVHFGLALHYALEMLESFSEDAIADAILLCENKYGFSLEAGDLEAIRKRLYKLVTDSTFLQLSEGKCYREKGLRYKNSLRYIDLLVEKQSENKWIVIDYKSGKHYHEEYLQQVQAYVRMVQEITGNKDVEGYLCYLLEDTIEFVKV